MGRGMQYRFSHYFVCGLRPLRWMTLIFASLMVSPAWADTCSPTPAMHAPHYPGAPNIPNSNNLRMPAGKAVAAEGQQVLLNGTILDAKCVPVMNARVELWQVDPFGKRMLATREDLVNAVPVFTGAGRTYSNNAGQFYFTTIFPAADGKSAPHFNLRIVVDGQKPFTTQLYFAGDARNAEDRAFSKLPADKQRSVSVTVRPQENGDLAVSTTLVMPFTQRYRGY